MQGGIQSFANVQSGPDVIVSALFPLLKSGMRLGSRPMGSSKQWLSDATTITIASFLPRLPKSNQHRADLLPCLTPTTPLRLPFPLRGLRVNLYLYR